MQSGSQTRGQLTAEDCGGPEFESLLHPPSGASSFTSVLSSVKWGSDGASHGLLGRSLWCSRSRRVPTTLLLPGCWPLCSLYDTGTGRALSPILQ